VEAERDPVKRLWQRRADECPGARTEHGTDSHGGSTITPARSVPGMSPQQNSGRHAGDNATSDTVRNVRGARCSGSYSNRLKCVSRDALSSASVTPNKDDRVSVGEREWMHKCSGREHMPVIDPHEGAYAKNGLLLHVTRGIRLCEGCCAQ